jgi:hypothetical protein
MQWSFVVQNSPSSHVFVLLTCWHVPPQFGVVQLHESLVHALLSLQSSWLSQVTVMVTAGPSDFVTSVVGTGCNVIGSIATMGVCTCVLLPAPKHGRNAI